MKWEKEGVLKSTQNFGQKILDVQASSSWKSKTIKRLLRGVQMTQDTIQLKTAVDTVTEIQVTQK
jgi:hypothetical protein